MSTSLPASIETTYETGRQVPDGLTVGRCNAAGIDHGVAWPAGTMKLDEATCPMHGRRLSLTTRVLGRRFYVMSREAAKAMAKSVRAERKAATQARVDAGVAKLVKDLEPGDVFRRSGAWLRVLEVAPSTRAKSRVAVTFAVQAKEVTDGRPWTTGTTDLIKAEEVAINPEAGELTWADLEPGRAAINILEDRVKTADMMAPHYRKDAKRAAASRHAWEQSSAERYLRNAEEYEAKKAAALELMDELLEARDAAPAAAPAEEAAQDEPGQAAEERYEAEVAAEAQVLVKLCRREELERRRDAAGDDTHELLVTSQALELLEAGGAPCPTCGRELEGSGSGYRRCSTPECPVIAHYVSA